MGNSAIGKQLDSNAPIVTADPRAGPKENSAALVRISGKEYMTSHLCYIKELNFNGCQVDGKSLTALAAAFPENRTVERLYLHSAKFDDESCAAWQKALGGKTVVEYLDISRVQLSSYAPLLTGFERNSSLKSLSISQWALASTDLEPLANFLKNNKTLQALTIEGTLLSQKDAFATAMKALKENKTLMCLRLGEIELDHARLLLDMLETNLSINEIPCDIRCDAKIQTQVNTQFQDDLAKAFARNRQKRKDEIMDKERKRIEERSQLLKAYLALAPEKMVELPALRIEHLQNHFYDSDKSRDGKIQESELPKLLELCGMDKSAKSSSAMSALFARADRDKSGSVDFDEFVLEYARLHLMNVLDFFKEQFAAVLAGMNDGKSEAKSSTSTSGTESKAAKYKPSEAAIVGALEYRVDWPKAAGPAVDHKETFAPLMVKRMLHKMLPDQKEKLDGALHEMMRRMGKSSDWTSPLSRMTLADMAGWVLDEFGSLTPASQSRSGGEVKLDSTAETKSDKELQKRAESRKDDRNADAIRRHNLWKDGDFVQFVNYLAQASMASAQWSKS